MSILATNLKSRTFTYIAVTTFFTGLTLLLPLAQAQAQGPVFTLLYSFGGPPRDGARPSALVLDKAGNLYGTTADGGAFFWGVVFKLTP
jgi:hypothetical protein